MIIVEVVKVNDKQFDLSVNKRVIGSSKAQSDADFHANFLRGLFQKVEDDYSRLKFPDTTGQ